MLKKLLVGTTLVAATLISTQLLADPDEHKHGQDTQCVTANCPANVTATDGRHGMGTSAMHGGHGKHARSERTAHHGEQGMQGAQRGHGGDGCPMHNMKREPT